MLCNLTVFHIFPCKEEKKTHLVWENTLLASHFTWASSFPMVSATSVPRCSQRELSFVQQPWDSQLWELYSQQLESFFGESCNFHLCQKSRVSDRDLEKNQQFWYLSGLKGFWVQILGYEIGAVGCALQGGSNGTGLIESWIRCMRNQQINAQSAAYGL